VITVVGMKFFNLLCHSACNMNGILWTQTWIIPYQKTSRFRNLPVTNDNFEIFVHEIFLENRFMLAR